MYTYSLGGYDAAGRFFKIGVGTEEQMFRVALAINLDGGELISAVREVWEEVNGLAHLLRIEPYRLGSPVTE